MTNIDTPQSIDAAARKGHADGLAYAREHGLAAALASTPAVVAWKTTPGTAQRAYCEAYGRGIMAAL